MSSLFKDLAKLLYVVLLGLVLLFRSTDATTRARLFSRPSSPAPAGLAGFDQPVK
jgi:hypothetical protein